MTKLLIYRNNCKNSKQLLDILAVQEGHDFALLCLDDFDLDRGEFIIKKYKMREIPCIATDNKILYGSEMFSFIKQFGEQEKTAEGFFLGNDGGGAGFSQQFASINDGEQLDTQNIFGSVKGIPGVQVDDVEGKKSKKGKKGKNGGSEVDKRYEQMMESRNNDTKAPVIHNNRVDFSKPLHKI